MACEATVQKLRRGIEVGRTQSYETAEVVSAARNLFWKDGFDSVSVSDMEKATGLSRSSIYHAFGSMRGLFDAAVRSYLDDVVRPRLAPLTGAAVDAGALARYLGGLADAIEALDDAKLPAGCLLVGTASTSLGIDPAVREVIAAYRAELSAAVTAGVRASKPEASEAVIAARATSITGAIIGANVLARVDRAEAVRLVRVLAAEIDTDET